MAANTKAMEMMVREIPESFLFCFLAGEENRVRLFRSRCRSMDRFMGLRLRSSTVCGLLSRLSAD